MDTLSPLQLTILETGGNAQLQHFLDFYNLRNSEEPLGDRYSTQASDFYRKKLRRLAEQGVSKDGKPLDFTSFADRPSYEEGRE